MKKFLITFFILIILGGVIFFFGWPHFDVPPGSYGVVISKTHGIDPVLVRAGEFRWIWYKLIPTNVRILVFKPETVNFTINFNNSLPSGDIYAAFFGLGNNLGLRADFSWEVQASISFRLNPDRIIRLVDNENISDQASLDNYMQNIALNIESLILRTLNSTDMDADRLEAILSGNIDTVLYEQVSLQFPEISDFSMIVKSAKFPDFVLYGEMRLLYEYFIASQREAIAMGLAERADDHIASRLRLSELEQIGELLTRYPVVLDYLAMQDSRNPE